MSLVRMDLVVTDGAHAVEDPEGFWTRGAYLTESEVVRLNEKIIRGEVTEVFTSEFGAEWLVSAGFGFNYFVHVATKCEGCGAGLVAAEAAYPNYPPVHEGCFRAYGRIR